MTQTAADSERRSPGLGAGFLTRVKIRNYKSIAACDVELAQLTVLVGRNGAGKSNFLDALRFLVEGLETSIEFALRSRGGIEAVRRHSTGHPHNFGIQLEFLIGPHERARYGFEIAARRPRGFVVRRETLQVWNP